MNYRTYTLLDNLHILFDLMYDTGWLAGAIEAGRKDIDPVAQANQIEKRNNLQYYVEQKIKEYCDLLEDYENAKTQPK